MYVCLRINEKYIPEKCPVYISCLIEMSLGYADINVVWGNNFKKRSPSKSKKARGEKEKEIDNVIDAYLRGDDSSCHYQRGSETASYNQNYPITAKSYNLKNMYKGMKVPDDDYYDLSNYHEPIVSMPRSDTQQQRKKSYCTDPNDVLGVLEKGMDYQMSLDQYYSNNQMFDTIRGLNSDANEYDGSCGQEDNTIVFDTNDMLVNQEQESSSNAYDMPTSHPQLQSMQHMMSNFEQVPQEPIDPNHYYLEMFLYVFGGILLIFVFEQILQIGMNTKVL